MLFHNQIYWNGARNRALTEFLLTHLEGVLWISGAVRSMCVYVLCNIHFFYNGLFYLVFSGLILLCLSVWLFPVSGVLDLSSALFLKKLWRGFCLFLSKVYSDCSFTVCLNERTVALILCNIATTCSEWTIYIFFFSALRMLVWYDFVFLKKVLIQKW